MSKEKITEETWDSVEIVNSYFFNRDSQRELFWRLYNEVSSTGGTRILFIHGANGIGKSSLLQEMNLELKEQLAGNDRSVQYRLGNAPLPEVFLFSLSRIIGEKDAFPLLDTAIAKLCEMSGNSVSSIEEKGGKLDTVVELTLDAAGLMPGATFIIGSAKLVYKIGRLFTKNKRAKKNKLQRVGKNAKMRKGELKEDFLRIDNAMSVNDLRSSLHIYFLKDLQRLSILDGGSPLVVFIDGYEKWISRLQDGSMLSKVKDWWVKELLQSIPNVLWVIASSDEFDWFANKSFCSVSKMRMLDEVSTKKCFLEAGIPENLIGELWKLTCGEPTYVGICVKRFRELIKNGEEVTIESFSNSAETTCEYLKNCTLPMQNYLAIFACFPDCWDVDMAERVYKHLYSIKEPVAEVFANEDVLNNPMLERVENKYRLLEPYKTCIRQVISNSQIERIEQAILVAVKTGICKPQKNRRCSLTEVTLICNLLRTQKESIFTEDEILEMVTFLQEKQNAYSYEECQLLVEGMEGLVEYAKKMNMSDRCVVLVSINLIKAINRTGNYNSTLAESVLKFSEKKLGKRDKDTIRCVQLLAASLAGEGDYASLKKAKSYYRLAYLRQKKELGEFHEDTIKGYQFYAQVCDMLGEYESARKMLEKVLHFEKQKLGDDNEDLLRCEYALAVNCQNRGKNIRAKTLFTRVYETRKSIFSANHPSTIKVMNALGGHYRVLGDYEKALNILNECYEISCNTFGKTHSVTLMVLYNIGITYRVKGEKGLKKACEEGDIQEAKKEQDLARDILTKCYLLRVHTLGKGHRDVHRSLLSIGNIWMNRRDYSKAKILYEWCHKMFLDTFGPKHSDTLTVVSNLIYLYRMIDDVDEAIRLGEDNKKTYQEYLGEEHPLTRDFLENLGVCYLKKGKIRDAIESFILSDTVDKETKDQMIKSLDGAIRTLSSHHHETYCVRDILSSTKSKPLKELLVKIEEAERQIAESINIGTGTQ